VLTGQQALALFADAKLTTKQCNTIRLQTEDLMVNIYPPYYVIKEAKNACYQVANPAEGIPTLTYWWGLCGQMILRVMQAVA
jgi:hypothetical protein